MKCLEPVLASLGVPVVSPGSVALGRIVTFQRQLNHLRRDVVCSHDVDRPAGVAAPADDLWWTCHETGISGIAHRAIRARIADEKRFILGTSWFAGLSPFS